MGTTVMVRRCSALRKALDLACFPARAFTLIENELWLLSSLASERFYYAAEEIEGYCLDVGCGKNNRFVNAFLRGNGVGIDVYKYPGLDDTHIVRDMSHFPFPDATFHSVTFLACINHVPEPMRDRELSEAYRCLKSGGNVIITMGNPIAEVLVHKIVWLYDKVLGTQVDVDTQRGMREDEALYLLDREIVERLSRVGFVDIKKRYCTTQWCLNHMFIAWKG
jgi:SAM-dependent methyltransferase